MINKIFSLFLFVACFAAFISQTAGDCAVCGENQTYTECGCSCPPTCSDYPKHSKICTQQCVKGCFCKRGYILNSAGKCVKPEDCEVCGENQTYMECGSSCPPTCSDDQKNPKLCTQQCVKGCFCRDGYILNSAGKCVKPEDCEVCGKNQTYTECGSSCPPTCSDDPKNPKLCTQQCVKGCFCRDGYILNSTGKCVKPEDCEVCGENQTYMECGSACPPTCADDPKKPKACNKRCGNGCFCKRAYILNSAGKCVKPEDC